MYQKNSRNPTCHPLVQYVIYTTRKLLRWTVNVPSNINEWHLDKLCINWSPRAAELGNSWTWIAGWSIWTYARLIDNQVLRVSRVKSNELSDKHVSQLLIIFRIREVNGVNVDLLMNFSVMFICCIWNVDCDSHCIYIYIWIYILKRAILMKVLVCDSVWFSIFILFISYWI